MKGDVSYLGLAVFKRGSVPKEREKRDKEKKWSG
jgi:hypothetical protein